MNVDLFFGIIVENCILSQIDKFFLILLCFALSLFKKV